MKQYLKGMAVCFALLLWGCALYAQKDSIEKVEYYIDSDPGYGKATLVSTTHGQNVSGSVSLNPANLSYGVHLFGIRAMDSAGRWSLDNKLLFVKNTSPVAAPKIIQAEYYIDTDPGYGNAAQLTFTHAINVSDSVNLVPSSLSYGVHLFGIRAKDSTGHWSLDNKWLFVKSPSPVAAPKIVKVEYYIGTDPGYGKADSVKGFTPIVNLVDSAKVDVAGLANDSTYLIGIRAQDANGAWSLDNKLSVTVNGTFPILLTSLTGQYVNDADVLTAVIQVAVNVKVVQLEKSTDGTNFTYLGNMATAPVTPGTYKYNDENPSAGNSYYRLRIVNNDGSFSYSYIVLLNHTVAFTIEAYPNPVQNNLTVHFQNANAGTYNLMLTDIQGRNVFVQKVSTTQGQTGDMNISLSGYAAGTYFMQVTDASGKVVTTQKIIKEQ